MEIYLADEQDVPLPIEALGRLARTVLEEEGLPAATEVGILFVTDEVMAGYNRRFLGKEGPTDVLALPLTLPDVPAHGWMAAGQNGPPLGIGDVFVAPGFVRRQALESGLGIDDEMFLMVTHGLLHLLGYDHTTDAEAEVMEGRERALLALVGVERR